MPNIHAHTQKHAHTHTHKHKVGEIAIWRMRRRAEEALKEKFDLKAFHSVLLGSGPLPLDTLSSLVDEWVASF